MTARFHPNTNRPLDRVEGPGLRKGVPGAEKAGTKLSEKTASWPDVGPHWGSSFNRATKMPVVKTRPAKKGLD